MDPLDRKGGLAVRKDTRAYQYGEAHPRHPVRNFFYVLYTLFNAVSFGTLFYAIAADEPLVTIGAAACVAIAVLVGIVNEFIDKR